MVEAYYGLFVIKVDPVQRSKSHGVTSLPYRPKKPGNKRSEGTKL